MTNTALVLRSFVADVAFRAARLPAWGNASPVLDTHRRRHGSFDGPSRRDRRALLKN
jgi:hypothetical protein